MNLNTTELVAAALVAGVITKGGGGWLSFGEHKLGQGDDKAAAALAEKPELIEQISAAVAAKSGAPDEKPKLRSKSSKDERRTFKVKSAVLHDNEHYADGDPVEITEKQFDQLKTGGVVDGSWDDGK